MQTRLKYHQPPERAHIVVGVGFTDMLPAGLVVATPNRLTGSCGGGTITATAGSNTISLSGATLAKGALCTFAVNVTGTSPGIKNNTSGAVTSTESGNGNTVLSERYGDHVAPHDSAATAGPAIPVVVAPRLPARRLPMVTRRTRRT